MTIPAKSKIWSDADEKKDLRHVERARRCKVSRAANVAITKFRLVQVR